MGNIDYDKIFRFWKLRVKGYMPADESTKDYIVNKFKDCINQTCTVNFKKFYCKTVLSGKYTNGICKIESKKCEEALEQKKKYDGFFETDLEPAVWSKAPIKNLECASCCNAATDCGSCPSDGGENTPTSENGNMPTSTNSAAVPFQTSFLGIALWVMLNTLY